MVAPFRSGCQKPPTLSPQQENVKNEPKENKKKREGRWKEREKKKEINECVKMPFGKLFMFQILK